MEGQTKTYQVEDIPTHLIEERVRTLQKRLEETRAELVYMQGVLGRRRELEGQPRELQQGDAVAPGAVITVQSK
jgi:hypothetical protein